MNMTHHNSCADSRLQDDEKEEKILRLGKCWCEVSQKKTCASSEDEDEHKETFQDPQERFDLQDFVERSEGEEKGHDGKRVDAEFSPAERPYHALFGPHAVSDNTEDDQKETDRGQTLINRVDDPQGHFLRGQLLHDFREENESS